MPAAAFLSLRPARGVRIAHTRDGAVMPRLPRQKPPGRSKQDYATPLVLLHAVQRRLGIGVFACDFASTAANTVAVSYCDSAANALEQSRVFAGWVWLKSPLRETGAVGATRGRAIAARRTRGHVGASGCGRQLVARLGPRSLLRVVPERTDHVRGGDDALPERLRAAALRPGRRTGL